jgi:hypothetical protein
VPRRMSRTPELIRPSGFMSITSITEIVCALVGAF